MIALVALLLAAHADVAVLDVKTSAGVDAALGPYLTQVIAAEVALRTGTRPLVKDDIKALLGFEAARQKLGCEGADSCIAEIAGALGVSKLVDASVSASGEHYLVSAALLDARKAQPMARATELSAKETPALVEAMRRATAQLFSTAPLADRPPPRGEQPVLRADAPTTPAQGAGFSRRSWAAVLGGTALALAAGGAGFGLTALSAAHNGEAGTARRRAHVADALFAGALIGAGVAVYLWRTDDSRAAATASAVPAGGQVSVAVRW